MGVFTYSFSHNGKSGNHRGTHCSNLVYFILLKMLYTTTFAVCSGWCDQHFLWFQSANTVCGRRISSSLVYRLCASSGICGGGQYHPGFMWCEWRRFITGMDKSSFSIDALNRFASEHYLSFSYFFVFFPADSYFLGKNIVHSNRWPVTTSGARTRYCLSNDIFPSLPHGCCI